MKSTRKIAALLAGAMCTTLLTACGTGQTATGGESQTAGSSETQVTESAAETNTTAGGEVTIYHSHPADWTEPLFREFEEETGIKVNVVSAGTGELMARVQAEQDNPLGDIIWGGDAASYVSFQGEYMQPYVSPEAANFPDKYKDSNGYWVAFNVEPSVVIYNTKLVSEADAPKSWADICDPKFKGQIAIADPAKSSTGFVTLVSIMRAVGGEDDDKAYEALNSLVYNLDGKVQSSSSLTYKTVVDGEYMIGLTYEEAAIKYVRAGADIAIVYPEEGQNVALVPIGIIKDCKNEDNAKVFIDFALSKKVQEQLNSFNRRSGRTDVEDAEDIQAIKVLDEIKSIGFHPDWVLDNTEKIKDTFKEIIQE